MFRYLQHFWQLLMVSVIGLGQIFGIGFSQSVVHFLVSVIGLGQILSIGFGQSFGIASSLI